MGLEASLLIPGGKIFAVERHPERAAQIAANRDHFGVDNLKSLRPGPGGSGAAAHPHRVFVGGGGGNRERHHPGSPAAVGAGGRVVVTAALLETLEAARTALKQAGWEVEVVQVQVSRSHSLGGGTALQALNPVWIVTGCWTNTGVEKSPPTPL